MNQKPKIIKGESDWDEHLAFVMNGQNNQVQLHSGKPQEYPCIVITILTFDHHNGHRFIHSFVYPVQAQNLINYKNIEINE